MALCYDDNNGEESRPRLIVVDIAPNHINILKMVKEERSCLISCSSPWLGLIGWNGTDISGSSGAIYLCSLIDDHKFQTKNVLTKKFGAIKLFKLHLGAKLQS